MLPYDVTGDVIVQLYESAILDYKKLSAEFRVLSESVEQRRSVFQRHHSRLICNPKLSV